MAKGKREDKRRSRRLVNNTFEDTPPSATPTSPFITNTVLEPAKQPVKPATPDLILFDDEDVPIETISALLFEEIGGQELINIARNDTINGQSVVYRPIRNLSSLALKYGPLRLIALQNTSDSFFNNFPIKLDERTPVEGNGPGGLTVYVENTLVSNNPPVSTANLIIEVVNMEDDERVEIQILTSGDVLSDTIYIESTEEES